MIKINIIYENEKVVGYVLEPLDEATAIEITEEEFKKLKLYLGNLE